MVPEVRDDFTFEGLHMIEHKVETEVALHNYLSNNFMGFKGETVDQMGLSPLALPITRTWAVVG